MQGATIALPVLEESHVGEARRTGVAIAAQLGFSKTDQEKVAIVITEAAKNLLYHAHQGEILLNTLSEDLRVAFPSAEGQGRGPGLELLALDRGPGMDNISQCLQDGYSSAGTAGTGLGAIRRLSSGFDIYSLPQMGTAILAQIWPTLPAGSTWTSCDRGATGELGVVCLAKAGEEVCGDAWSVQWHEGQWWVLVVDGLGHGPIAATASQAAVQVLQAHLGLSPEALVEQSHQELKQTRGAVLAIAQINCPRQEVLFAGIGNLTGFLITSEKNHNLVSYNGTVGYQVRKIQQYTYPWEAESILILHSDGLGGQWHWERYPGLLTRHASLIAGVLYRDFQRERRDDATIVVLRTGLQGRQSL